jgi:leader peptidase (prepilin peptidase)/N-methyltransferase
MLADFVAALQSLPPAYLAALVGVLGLLIGSFLNVVIFRLPQMMDEAWAIEAEAYRQKDQADWLPPAPQISLSRPASRCGHCGHAIRWYENIPLVSWLFLRAKCSACKTPISWRYPFIELLTGALFAYSAWRFGVSWAMLAWCGFTALVVALFWIDWDTTFLPDSLTQPLLWLGLITTMLGHNPLLASFSDSFWGAVFGYALFIPIAWVVGKLKGQQAMGNGDYKLMAALGAWLGWQALLPIVLMSSITGSIIGIGLMLTAKLRSYGNQAGEGGVYMPFGPFLVLAGLLVYIVGWRAVLAPLGI